MPGTHPNATAEGVQRTSTLYGEPVQGGNGLTHAHGDIQPAGLHSTLPYRPPKRRDRDNPDRLLCSFEGCRAFPMKSQVYCTGHARSLGLVSFDKKVETHHDDAD